MIPELRYRLWKESSARSFADRAFLLNTDLIPKEAHTDLNERIQQLVEEVIAGTSLFVVDVNVRGRRGSQVAEVFLDSEAELNIDQLADISREVGFLIETEDLVKGKYNLIVSSPGVERPLSDIRQYRKNVGRRLRVHVSVDENVSMLEGTLIRVEDDHIVLKEKNNESIIAMAAIAKAVVQLPW